MDHLEQIPLVPQFLIISGRSCVQAFCSPGNVINPAERVDVEDVEISWSIEEEGKGSQHYLKQNVEFAIKSYVDKNGDSIDESCDDENPSHGIDGVQTSRNSGD